MNYLMRKETRRRRCRSPGWEMSRRIPTACAAGGRHSSPWQPPRLHAPSPSRRSFRGVGRSRCWSARTRCRTSPSTTTATGKSLAAGPARERSCGGGRRARRSRAWRWKAGCWLAAENATRLPARWNSRWWPARRRWRPATASAAAWWAWRRRGCWPSGATSPSSWTGLLRLGKNR